MRDAVVLAICVLLAGRGKSKRAQEDECKRARRNNEKKIPGF
jgi:hypothetical protein